jgi:signal transduction histidine kinase
VSKGIVSYLLLLLSVYNSIKGQQVSVFQSVTTSNGLPSNYVFAADEDENGFLWLGTDKGLAKYDGFRWQTFTINDGLPGNYVQNVFSTGKGGLWLGFSTKGLYYYDIGLGKCQLVAADNWGYHFQRNKNGDLFFYTNVNSDNKNTIGFVCEVANPAIAKKVFEIPRGKGNEYMMTDFANKIIYYNPSICTAGEINTFENWKKDTVNRTDRLTGVTTKINNDIFLGIGNLIIPHDIKLETKVNQHLSQKYYLGALYTDTCTWFWNEGDGIFNVSNNGFVQTFSEKQGLGTKLISNVHATHSGNLLISTLGNGLENMLPKGHARIDTENKPVKSLVQKNNMVYALLENYILKIDLADPTAVAKYYHTEKNIGAINIAEDDIVISTLSGFSVYTISNNALVKKKQENISSGVSSVMKQNNHFYVGTYGIGTYVYDVDLKRYERDLLTPPVAEKLIPFSNGYASLNYEDGVQLIYENKQRENISTKEGLPGNAVYDVHEYKDTFWISTANGVAAYTQGKVVKTFTNADGLKGSRCIYSFHDAKGGYWVLTDKYLNEKVGNKFNTLTSVSITNGDDDEAFSSIYNAYNNTLVIGSLKKIFLIQLDNIERTARATQPGLSHVFFDGIKVSDSFSFELPSDYKNVSFRFNPVDANPFAKSFIYYKLQGLEDNFVDLKDSLIISFPKLRAGKYKLFAKTTNADGVESGEKLLAIFSVAAPYWQRGWFILSCTLLAAMGLFWLYYLLRKRNERKKTAALLLEQTLTKERERISKDLHDHLGSAIVTMIAQTDNIESKLMNNNQQGALVKVKELSEQSRETVNVLRETIWAVQENSHSLEEFVLRTRNFLQRVLPQKNIEWNVEVNGQLKNKLTANQSLQLFRVIQEATQNIVKHAGAANANYFFNAFQNELAIEINDNGKGFDHKVSKSNNGLNNMQQRIAEISGKFEITSDKNGTAIKISLPLTIKPIQKK